MKLICDTRLGYILLDAVLVFLVIVLGIKKFRQFWISVSGLFLVEGSILPKKAGRASALKSLRTSKRVAGKVKVQVELVDSSERPFQIRFTERKTKASTELKADRYRLAGFRKRSKSMIQVEVKDPSLNDVIARLTKQGVLRTVASSDFLSEDAFKKVKAESAVQGIHREKDQRELAELALREVFYAQRENRRAKGQDVEGGGLYNPDSDSWLITEVIRAERASSAN
jgi:hypothetical protein